MQGLSRCYLLPLFSHFRYCQLGYVQTTREHLLYMKWNSFFDFFCSKKTYFSYASLFNSQNMFILVCLIILFAVYLKLRFVVIWLRAKLFAFSFRSLLLWNKLSLSRFEINKTEAQLLSFNRFRLCYMIAPLSLPFIWL